MTILSVAGSRAF